MPERLTHYTSDHDTIRQWAEERGGQPACVRGTGGRRGRGDIGMIRLDFPGYSGEGSLEEVSWDDWFEAFDENNLALAYQDRTADGQISHFNKLVSVDTAENRLDEEEGGRGRSRGRSAQRGTSGRSSGAGRRGREMSKSQLSTGGGASNRRGSGRSGARSRTTARSDRFNRDGNGGGTHSGSRRRGPSTLVSDIACDTGDRGMEFDEALGGAGGGSSRSRVSRSTGRASVRGNGSSGTSGGRGRARSGQSSSRRGSSLGGSRSRGSTRSSSSRSGSRDRSSGSRSRASRSRTGSRSRSTSRS